ncbi:hypothetical protein GCM10023335_56090 [Streptomyces siamensis]|uniref:Transposase n=1 Tax=Streptomyces siamensis TaxID=1274986 RepID=A0ABP9J8E1_9ACTN
MTSPPVPLTVSASPAAATGYGRIDNTPKNHGTPALTDELDGAAAIPAYTTSLASAGSCRVEHTFARMKCWKILGDCRLKGDGVHHAMRDIARLHNLALAGKRLIE